MAESGLDFGLFGDLGRIVRVDAQLRAIDQHSRDRQDEARRIAAELIYRVQNMDERLKKLDLVGPEATWNVKVVP